MTARRAKCRSTEPPQKRRLADGGWLGDLSLGSKFNTEWTFLNDVKARGRAAADEWLGSCVDSVGRTSSVDLQARFSAT
jgi:hypothetical protein